MREKKGWEGERAKLEEDEELGRRERQNLVPQSTFPTKKKGKKSNLWRSGGDGFAKTVLLSIRIFRIFGIFLAKESEMYNLKSMGKTM